MCWKIIINNFFLKLQSAFLVISNDNSFRVLFDKTALIYFCQENIFALEMASPGNRHGANCIGTLSFPTAAIGHDNAVSRNIGSQLNKQTINFTNHYTCVTIHSTENCTVMQTVSQKTATNIFMNKSQQILIIFGIQNSEEIWPFTKLSVRQVRHDLNLFQIESHKNFKWNLKSNRDLLNRIFTIQIESPNVLESWFLNPNRDWDSPITGQYMVNVFFDTQSNLITSSSLGSIF